MKKKFLKVLLLSVSAFTFTACGSQSHSSVPTQTVTGNAYQGVGEPSASLGKDGDTYLDTSTGSQYKKENGVWVLVESENIKTYSGNGEPDPSLGKDGDKYTNNVDGSVYEKQNGTWIKIVAGDQTYVVTFNLNGGHFADGSTTYPDQIVREGRWVNEPTLQPIKEHCTFLGWYISGSNTAWNFIGNPVYGNVDLVAKWSVNEEDKLTITVDPCNGQEAYTVETFVGDYYYPPVPSKDGQNFVGWFVKSTGEKYSGYVTASLAGQTIEAHYEVAKFNVSYQVEENDEVTITGLLNVETVSITIPSTINGRKVTKISSKAFNYRIYLVNVIIPSSIKVIEEGAFAGATKLTSIEVDSANLNYCSVNGVLYTKNMDTLVCYPTKAGESYTLPSTIKRIGSYAFYQSRDCGITSISFNQGLEEIGDYAFAGNETLSSLSLPSSLKKIGKAAFLGSTSSGDDDSYISPQGIITNAGLNEGLEEIGEMAFANQYFKETFSLPSTVKVLGPYAFANCTAIEKLVLPVSLETFGDNAFAGCTGIMDLQVTNGNTHFTSRDGILYNAAMTKVVMCPSGRYNPVTIPEGVVELGDYSFYMVDECQEYNLPSTLQRIGVEAFAQTYNLKTFVIPDSVTELGHDAFYASGISSLTIGSGLQTISKYAFDSTKLTSVEIPSNVKTIEYGAFGFTSSLKSVTFNEGLEEIGYAAFSNDNISSINLPNSLKSIGDSAFANNKITDLNLGNNFESLGVNAFYSESTSSNTITTITVSSGNANFAARNNILYSKDLSALYFAGANIVDDKGALSLPEGIKTIEPFAFASIGAIKSVTLPSTLEEIKEGAFYKTKITSITFPSSLKKIGEGVFYFSYLKDVTFNEGLEEIGLSAFAYSDVASVALPNSLKIVGETAFAKCMMLKTLSLGTGVEKLSYGAFLDTKIAGEIDIPASLVTIEDGVFSSNVSTFGQKITAFNIAAGNPNYTTDQGLLLNKEKTTVIAYSAGRTGGALYMPETITQINDYALACAGATCSSIVLPNGLKTIGDGGLAFMTSVSTINIPSTVTYIGEKAFAYWTSAQAIKFNVSEEYALSNYHPLFISGSNANATYNG